MQEGPLLHPLFTVASFPDRGLIALLPCAALLLWAQSEPPRSPGDRPPGQTVPLRLKEIRRKLDSIKPVDITAQRAVEYSRTFLAAAEKDLDLHREFAADRMGEAAESLLHLAEHQQHLQEGGTKRTPPADAIQAHLQRVYFRTQQADFFLRQTHNAQASGFPKWSRDFYQLAVRAYERKDLVAADENSKSAEDVVNALESLAQAASPELIPSRPPKPPVPE